MKYLFLATTAIALLSITVYAGKVKDTKFKHGRGFFDAPFDEIITTETPGATIIYTFDVSDPRHSENTVSGTSPITVAINLDSITKRPKTPGVIVHAYAKKVGMERTNMDTQTYIFVEDLRRLDNSGEKLVLRDALANVVDSVDYDDKAPWPKPADGTGKSLTRKFFDVNGDSNNPANWYASPQKDGTPGVENIF